YKVVDEKGGRILKADQSRRLDDNRYFYKSIQTLPTTAGQLSADSQGLFLAGKRVAEGQFKDAAVSLDGRWVALAKGGEGTAAPDLLVLLDCASLTVREVPLPRYLLVRPLGYIPELDRFLVWCPQHDEPQFFLVDAQTGDWWAAEGELSPYTHRTAFQRSRWPDWVWATRVSQRGDIDVTEVGLYHRYRFVFLPVATYPHLLARSDQIEVFPERRVVRVRLANDEIELPLATIPDPGRLPQVPAGSL
ncbi:MAG: hypothetical protein KC910_23145, partial [Candidatus Eremiobacteraeota bacterium]|nr:hypothetical protein [Candidatus Eremiobacteraeota bacterium]